MHYRLIRGSLAALLAGGLTAGLALAQVRQPGSSIAYDVKAMGQGDTKLAIKVSGVDADGTAHVTMTFAPPRVPQGSVPTLNGTITPAGAILPQFSAVTGTPHMGMSSAEAAAMSQSMIGQMLQFTLQPFNAFATAAGSRPELKSRRILERRRRRPHGPGTGVRRDRPRTAPRARYVRHHVPECAGCCATFVGTRVLRRFGSQRRRSRV